MFSSRSFMVSGIAFKYLIHFELIFVCGARVVQFHSFACGSPVFLTPFVEQSLFSPRYNCSSFVIN